MAIKENTASVIEDKLHINLVIDDPLLVGHFGPMEAAGSCLSVVIPDYLRLYTAIVDAASPRSTELSVSNSIARLGQTVDSAMDDLDELLKQSLGEHGQTATAIRQFELKLLDYIGSDSSAFHKLMASQVRETVRQAIEKSQMTPDSITKAVTESTEPKRQEQHKEVLEIIRRIESEVSAGKKVAEVIASTPMKGRPYEEVAFASLAPIADAASDLCEDTSKSKGSLGRDAGDFVVTHTVDGSPRFNIVYEAKAGAMNKAEWLREADVAIPNREASVFVGLAKNANAIPGKSGFTMLRDNVIVMHFDPETNPTDLAILAVVYRYALSIGRSKSGQNSSGLLEAASELRTIVTDLKTNHALSKNIEANGRKLKEFIEGLSKKLPSVLLLIEDGGDS